MTIRIAIVGFGKIARDEHLRAIEGNPDFELAAVVAREKPDGIAVPCFPTIAEMLAAMPGNVDAVAICTPPGPRFALASEVIAAGLPVLLEKPPTATLGELDVLIQLAKDRGVAIFTAWHSQYAAGVNAAAAALKGEAVASLHLDWREDVRVFHAGQQWIWEPGGFGVLDTGINGLSILTRILQEPLLVKHASLLFPANRQAPIAAEIAFHWADHRAVMDWRSGGEPCWSITIGTQSGRKIHLTRGGAELAIDGIQQSLPPHDEYRAIYAEFADIVRSGTGKIDPLPLRTVADCFLIAERKTGEDFV